MLCASSAFDEIVFIILSLYISKSKPMPREDFDDCMILFSLIIRSKIHFLCSPLLLQYVLTKGTGYTFEIFRHAVQMIQFLSSV